MWLGLNQSDTFSLFVDDFNRFQGNIKPLIVIVYPETRASRQHRSMLRLWSLFARAGLNRNRALLRRFSSIMWLNRFNNPNCARSSRSANSHTQHVFWITCTSLNLLSNPDLMNPVKKCCSVEIYRSNFLGPIGRWSKNVCGRSSSCVTGSWGEEVAVCEVVWSQLERPAQPQNKRKHQQASRWQR